MNINAYRKGQSVRLLREVRALAADFPGWGDPNYADHFVQLEAGHELVVVSVNSHGSNPWTRYTLHASTGERIIDAVDGIDFEWID